MQAQSLLQQDFSAAYLERAINDSLRRLGTDYLDILYLHDIPLMAVRSDAVFEALDRIQSAGKVRYIGVSADDRAALEAALNFPSISVVQTAVHSLRPTSRWPTLSTLADAGIGVVANHIFGSGPALSIGRSIPRATAGNCKEPRNKSPPDDDWLCCDTAIRMFCTHRYNQL